MKDESTEEDQKQLEERAAERALVAQVRQGDLAAFDALMDRYQDRVMRVIFSILKDPMDREEVAQDVFLTLFEKIDAFRGEASLSTWIHRIAVNAALMYKTRMAVTLPLGCDRDLMLSIGPWGGIFGRPPFCAPNPGGFLMSATLIERTEHSLTLQVTIPLAASMLASERRIQSALNEAGCLATGAALERFDTDGAAGDGGQPLDQ